MLKMKEYRRTDLYINYCWLLLPNKFETNFKILW